MKAPRFAVIAAAFATILLCARPAAAQIAKVDADILRNMLLGTSHMNEIPRGQKVRSFAETRGYSADEVCLYLANIAAGVVGPDPDPWLEAVLRQAAISAIGDVRCASAVPHLRVVMAEGDPQFVQQTIMALVRIGGNQIVNVCAAILGSPDKFNAGDRSCLFDELLIYMESGQAKADGVDMQRLQTMISEHVAREPDKSLTKTLESIKVALAEEINKE